VSEIYHLSSTHGYQLSIAHIVDKHKYFYYKDDIRKGTTMQPITINKTLHVVHNQHMH
jgi:hypothetical protein